MRYRHENRSYTWLLALVLLSTLLVIPSCSGETEKSETLWREMQQDLPIAGVKAVELRGPGPEKLILAGDEADDLLDAFVSGVFDEDNPNNYGPTPEITVLFMMDDTVYLAVGQWPDGRLQIQQDGRQFLVEAPQLRLILTERGFTYE